MREREEKIDGDKERERERERASAFVYDGNKGKKLYSEGVKNGLSTDIRRSL